MATEAQVVFGVVQARIRRDGGPLCAVHVYWPHRDRGGVEVYDPRMSGEVAREVRRNGGEAQVEVVR